MDVDWTWAGRGMDVGWTWAGRGLDVVVCVTGAGTNAQLRRDKAVQRRCWYLHWQHLAMGTPAAEDRRIMAANRGAAQKARVSSPTNTRPLAYPPCVGDSSAPIVVSTATSQPISTHTRPLHLLFFNVTQRSSSARKAKCHGQS